MKSYQQLSLLTLTLAFVAAFAATSAQADDMMKPDAAMTTGTNDTMAKPDSMVKDKMDTSKAMIRTGDHMDKKDAMAKKPDAIMKPDGMTKDMPDKMAPDNAMMNK